MADLSSAGRPGPSPRWPSRSPSSRCGLLMAPFFGIVLAGVERHETGSASGTMTAAQQLGSALGVAVLGTLFFGLLGGHVAGATSASATKAFAAAGVPAVQRPSLVTGLRDCGPDPATAKDAAATPASYVRLGAELSTGPVRQAARRRPDGTRRGAVRLRRRHADHAVGRGGAARPGVRRDLPDAALGSSRGVTSGAIGAVCGGDGPAPHGRRRSSARSSGVHCLRFWAHDNSPQMGGSTPSRA